MTKVSFPSDFSAVRISHLPIDTTAKSVVDLLAPLGFVVSEDCVRVITTTTAANTTNGTSLCSADVRVEDPLFAKNLCGLPVMKKPDGPRAIPITAPMPSQGTNYRRVDSKKVNCSWYKPTRKAWLNFGNGDIATKVGSRFSAGIYKVLDQAVQSNEPTLGEGFRNPWAWTLRLYGVSGPAKKEDITRNIAKGIVPRHIELSPASYDVDLPMANTLIESLLLQAGPMERWEGALPDTGGKRFKARARFLNDADARQAVKMFHDRPLPFKGNSGGKLTMQLVHSARFKILNRVYEAIEPEISKHKPAWVAKHLRYTAYDPAQGLRVLKIEGEVSADVASAKATLEQIIQGQVLTSSKDREEEKAVWAPSFAGAANGRAQRRMKQLERELGIIIVRDRRRSQIRLLGPRAKCDEARPVLVELAKDELEAAYSSSSSATESPHVIELDGELFTRAFRGGYRAIAAAIGEDNVTLDIVSTPRRVIVAGSDADFKLAQDILHGTNPQEGASKAQRETDSTGDCAICWTPAENPVLLTACKHVYCLGCFEDLCFAGVNSTSDPRVICQGEAAKCRETITLATLQEHLSSAALEDLLEASFTAHVTRNLTTLKHCPTPDCDQLYRASATAVSSSGPASLFTCPSCLTAICTTCHVSHDGLTCAEHRDQLSGGHEALKKTKQKLGIKDCPKCGIMIEKRDGCNHMTCSACGTHICWVCLETFPGSGPVYEHMNRKHDGIGI